MLENNNFSGSAFLLSSAKQEVLKRLLCGELAKRPNTNTICQRSDPQHPSPLSLAQERLWFLNQLEPSSAAYNISLVMKLEGELDVAILEECFQEVVRRHEILRTTFRSDDGQPVQHIASTLVVKVTVETLMALDDTDREAKVFQVAMEEKLCPFNLQTGPLVRMRLLQVAMQEHVLLLTMHHIVSDGWSLDIFINEMTTLYQAFVRGEPSPLPLLSIQYADFAVWQRNYLSDNIIEAHLNYWKAQLNGIPPVLNLPTDQPRPAVHRFVGASYGLEISEKLLTQLHVLRRSEGLTLYMLLLAAFEVCLSIYSGQDDFCVGTPVSNRKSEETESLIGFFVNTLVVRANLSGNPSVQEMLRRVRETVVSAQEHQDVPFAKLVSVIQPERSMSYSPLFQVMFALQNVRSRRETELDGLKLTPLEGVSSTAQFDLSLEMFETGGILKGRLHYSTDLFEETSIVRMLRHYQRLLEEMVANPEARLSELSLLTKSELKQVVIEWNQTDRVYPQEGLIHERFEAQVAENAKAVAVVFEGQAVTYEELNARANQLAHYLRTLGVGPEVLVGLCLERSIEMVVGLLGILKAGGAYVPLDPEYPRERLAFMLADAGLTVVLTQQALLPKLPSHPTTMVCLDTDWAEISQSLTTNPNVRLWPECAAYIIYTSGSTGQPKGVLVSHANVGRLFDGTQEKFQFGKSDVWTVFHSFAFDFSVWECWGALLFGGRVVLVPHLVSRTPSAFYGLLVKEQVTVLNQTPSAFAQLIQTEQVEGVSDQLALRYVILGGEALDPQMLAPWFQTHGEERPCIVNMYGITETTVHVTFQRVVAADVHVGARSLIGRPLPDLQGYILDKQLNPVPIGVPGELYVGGAGLARGYLNRPHLTALRFIPHRFSEEPGSRLYRSGDLARYRDNGDIEYLGRVDQQVKIRGHRIEPAEIESQLTQFPAIGEAVVLVREDRPGDKRLVAYIVPRQNMAFEIGTVRDALRERLPAYMVPAALVVLDAMPLTPNGKVDRRALPVPDSKAYGRGEGESMAPRTATEALLASIWTEILGVARVGVTDNFFEIGGDSILALQIVARVRQNGLPVTLRQMFQYQTIEELVAVMEAEPSTDSVRTVILAEQGLVVGNVPLTPIQQWFFEQSLPNPHHYNQAVLLEAKLLLDFESMKNVVRELLRHHDALRVRFVYQEEKWQQRIESEVSQDVCIYVDLSSKPEEEQEAAIEAEAKHWQTTLHLTEGPLLRVVWFDLGKHRLPRLLVIIHHLVVDGVSWRILLDDLQRGYRHCIDGQAITLPAKTTSWKEWAERLHAFAGAGGLQNETAYWLDSRWEHVHPLPVELSPVDTTDVSMESVTVSLGVKETQDLLQDVPSAYGTRIDEILLTALAQTLGEWANCSAIVIDLEGHGREDLFPEIDLSRTVGWFTSMYPVLLQLDKDMPLGDAIKTVKDQLRRIPNRGIGYGILRYLEPQGDVRARLTSLPSPQVRFNYLGQFDQVFAMDATVKLANESAGPTSDRRNSIPYVFDINVTMFDRRLTIVWTYKPHHYRHETITMLGSAFVNALTRLIAHCLSPEAGGYSPSDFPDIDVDQDTLNVAFEEMGL